MNKIVKEKLKEAILLFIIIVAFGSVLAIMLKYENEGEKNLPFNLTEMLVISSVDEKEKTENLENYKRNLDLNQYNDFYLKFEKNPDFKETVYIENIIIENMWDYLTKTQTILHCLNLSPSYDWRYMH